MNISIIGVPTDYGQSKRGVDIGPSAIRYAGVVEKLQGIGHFVRDEGDIRMNAKQEHPSNVKLLNLMEVVEISTLLAKKVQNVTKQHRFPLVLGGDHSVAIGTLAGLAMYYKNLGVIWFDAHADLNTPETTPSGNIHGMPLAASIGLGHEMLTRIGSGTPKIRAENIVIIGARSIDPGERLLIKEQGIKVFTMHEIDVLGMARVMEDTMHYLKAQGVDGVHLSFDLDSMDPLYTPGVGTPVSGGLTYRESRVAMEMLYAAGVVTSAEFVEVNPIVDDQNRTAEVAVALIGSLLGEKLL